MGLTFVSIQPVCVFWLERLIHLHLIIDKWASLVVQMVENLTAMWETWVQSLDWEDPLEKGMATHSSILAWKILWTEEPGRLWSMGSQRVGHNWATNTYLLYVHTHSYSYI